MANIFLGANAVSAAAAIVFSLTPSGAPPPDETGKKFSEAQTALKDAGFTAVVSSVVGDKLPQSDCLVTRELLIPPMGAPYEVNPAPGFSSTRVAVSLDCSGKKGNAKSP